MSNLLLIRADANTRIGTGHIMRCLALAEVWLQSGGQVALASAEISPTLQERAQKQGCEIFSVQAVPGSVHDGVELIQLARKSNAAWIALDGYRFDSEYQNQIRQACFKLLVLDDYGHAGHYHADFVLNQNIGASTDLYTKRDGHTQLLLGTSFVLLRQEFSRWRDWQRPVPEKGEKILVTLGGSDPDNVTAKIIEALRKVSVRPVEATIVVGGSNPHGTALEAALKNFPFPIHLLRNVSNMPDLMVEADLAIAAGGATVWELAFLGLPMLLVVLAENQVSNTEQLSRAGVGVNLGWHAQLSPESVREAVEHLLLNLQERLRMAERGRRLVDGYGAVRVWLRLNEHRLKLRPATQEDCKRLWEWANEPDIRAVSFSQDPIPWEGHVQWFEARLQDSGCFLWMIENEQGQPIGQVRFDQKEDKSAVISLSLGCEFRGRNTGSLAVWTACQKLFGETLIDKVTALIKPDNEASQRAFQKAGFEKTGTTSVNHQPAVTYEFRRHRT